MAIFLRMSSAQRNPTDMIYNWFRQVILFNLENLKDLFVSFIFVTGGAMVITFAWAFGWEGGITYNLMYIISNVIPGPPGPAFIAPLTFLFGVASVFWFDSFKRLQGILLLIPGFLGVIFVIFSFDRLNISYNLLTILAGIVSFAAGLVYSGVVEAYWRGEKMEVGFYRLSGVVLVVGLLGIFEATFKYTSPILLNTNDPVQFGNIAIPMEMAIGQTIETFSFASEPVISGVTFLFYIGFLAVLVKNLLDFTQYELDKNILLLGPDRAGKTWMMTGAGYCLREKAMNSDYGEPDLNENLLSYHNTFVEEDFDNAKLESNDPDEFEFFRFTYEHGLVPRRKVNVTTIDYAGEHLEALNVENPWEDFESKFGGKTYTDSEGNTHELDGRSLPSLEILQQLNRSGDIDAKEIPALLSVMVAEYDTIGLTIPPETFVSEKKDDELPDHIDKQSDIEETLNQRVSDPIKSKVGKTGYFTVYENLLKKYDRKDFFFIITKSDVFLRSFKDEPNGHVDPKGHPNWQAFRQHVLDHIYDENERSEVSFLTQDSAKKAINYYPVYFEPRTNSNDYHTSSGNFKPNLNPNDHSDEFSPLRGLNKMLKRMGR